jgi:hypothetical protein
MRPPEHDDRGHRSLEIKSTADLFAEIDEAMDGVGRWLANDLGMPSLALADARVKLGQLRELVGFLEHAA